MTHPWQIETSPAALLDYPSTKDSRNCQPMTQEQAKLYFTLTMMDLDGDTRRPFDPAKSTDLPFASDVLWKRITGMELPIQVTPGVLFAPAALCDRIAGAVVYLIDLLQTYGDANRLITMSDVAKLYPWGFYKEEVLYGIVNNYMKARVHPWSPVYIMKE